MWQLRQDNFAVFEWLYAPSLSVNSSGVPFMPSSCSSCLAHAKSFPPLQSAMYSASVPEWETMSCRQLYHAIGWFPRFHIAPLCDQDCSHSYEASAYATRSGSRGLRNIIPSRLSSIISIICLSLPSNCVDWSCLLFDRVG